MKKLLFIFFPVLIFSQYDGKVVINTDQPTATFDVAGNARFRNITEVTTTIYLLATDEDGNVIKIKASAIVPTQGICPNFLRDESNPYYLKFSSSSSIPNPNSALVIEGLNFVSAGTWIAENNYFYSYSNTTGQPLNINDFSVNFGSGVCNYKN